MSYRQLRYPTADELRERGPRGIPADRLMRAIRVDEGSGCWLWTKGRTTSGYGHFFFRGAQYQAHLLVYTLIVGPLPDAGLEPDHLCRNRGCVNPSHIEFVTHAVNSQRGAASTLSLETVRQIRAARAAGAGVRALARKHGVNHAIISRICNGLAWPLLPEDQIAAERIDTLLAEGRTEEVIDFVFWPDMAEAAS